MCSATCEPAFGAKINYFKFHFTITYSQLNVHKSHCRVYTTLHMNPTQWSEKLFEIAFFFHYNNFEKYFLKSFIHLSSKEK